MVGPLHGIRILEMAGIGPGPFCGMMLADHGAEVIRVDRPGSTTRHADPLLRSRKSVILDMKSPADVIRLRELAKTCDGLIEGYRPGVMERLGIGPDVLLADNPKLIYGRMTGWGQDGPLAQLAGHDINYIAISGVLGACAREGAQPTPPLNLAGDFGGGGMMLAFGMVSALLAVRNGASGQVVDCAMTDGSAILMAMMWGYRAAGQWNEQPGTNLLDTGAPFYDTYRTACGGYVAIGAIEPQFFAKLRRILGIDNDPLFDRQMDRVAWPAQRRRLTDIFAMRTRDEWCSAMEGIDACFAPVLAMSECLTHPHNQARSVFVEVDGVVQPAPAPRYSATPCELPSPPRPVGTDQHLLAAWEKV